MSGHEEPAPVHYALRLFIAGSSPRSRRTIENLQRICATHLEGRVELEIVDIYQQAHLASESQVVAAPTLLRMTPLPHRRIIGDLSDETAVLRGLDVLPSPPTDDKP